MTIYAVYAEHVDRNILLGYATGNKVDIETYYDDKKAYGLLLEEVKPIHITAELGQEIRALKIEKARIEKRLDEVNKQLKSY